MATPKRTSQDWAIITAAAIGAIGAVTAALIGLRGGGPTTPPPEPTAAASAAETPSPSPLAGRPAVADPGCIQLLTKTWNLHAEDDAAEETQEFKDLNLFRDKAFVRVSYDLHGLEAQDGVRHNDSAVVLYQNGWYVASLSTRGTNRMDGPQVVDIPLREFIGLPEGGDPRGGPVNLQGPISSVHVRFWHAGQWTVEILGIQACR